VIVHVEVEVVEVAVVRVPQAAVPPLLTLIDIVPVGAAEALLTVTVEVVVWP